MPRAQEYASWPTDSDVPLFLELAQSTGEGATGKTPQVGVRRFRETATGTLLDNFWWNGATFQAAPFFFNMIEVDDTDNPGVYRYTFEQSLIGLEHIYSVYFRHPTDPVGFAHETHVITNEVYIPRTQPDPIIFGPSSVMGQLQDIKDGGTGDFDGTKHSLAKLGLNFDRVLGLLHHNAMVDNQVYDTNGQLTLARLRVFDSEADVPATPGGAETAGLTQEYEITAEYAGLNNLTSYVLKQVL